ncbi:MAG TPA: peptide deformylase [Abditibacteriaceae bacterium]|jgi:peptide deformylase
MILPIRIWGDPVLTKRAVAVDRVTKDERRLIDNMFETMEAADGAGLAAPQVGVSKRIFVFRRGDDFHALINPKILRREGSKIGDEGCLSIPGAQAKVERAAKVLIAGRDQKGKAVEWECEDGEEQGRAGAAVQHELDHLDGILYVTKCEPDTLSWLIETVDDEGEEIVALKKTTPDEILQAYKARVLPKNLHISDILYERVMGKK